MTHPVLALKHLPSHDNQQCSGCAAEFVPSEDSGSRLLSLRGPEMSFSALLCGGCHSKWSHGSPITLKGPPARLSGAGALLYSRACRRRRPARPSAASAS